MSGSAKDQDAKGEQDVVERYFDLERASQPADNGSGGSSHTDKVNFEPIVRDGKDDQKKKELAEAARRKNPLGGSGPFVYANSGDIFTGSRRMFTKEAIAQREKPSRR